MNYKDLKSQKLNNVNFCYQTVQKHKNLNHRNLKIKNHKKITNMHNSEINYQLI